MKIALSLITNVELEKQNKKKGHPGKFPATTLRKTVIELVSMIGTLSEEMNSLGSPNN